MGGEGAQPLRTTSPSRAGKGQGDGPPRECAAEWLIRCGGEQSSVTACAVPAPFKRSLLGCALSRGIRIRKMTSVLRKIFYTDNSFIFSIASAILFAGGEADMYEAIRNMRLEKGMTQLQVSNALGQKLQTYRNYEKGDRRVPVSVIIRIAQFYAINVDYLLGRTDIKEPYPPAG